jgi:hypothetical protein
MSLQFGTGEVLKDCGASQRGRREKQTGSSTTIILLPNRDNCDDADWVRHSHPSPKSCSVPDFNQSRRHFSFWHSWIGTGTSWFRKKIS